MGQYQVKTEYKKESKNKQLMMVGFLQKLKLRSPSGLPTFQFYLAICKLYFFNYGWSILS